MSETIIAVLGTIIGVIIGFFLSIIRDFFKNKKEAKQILEVINVEIWENSFALIHPEKSYYDSLKTNAKNIINSKIGSLCFHNEQLQLILKIYTLFDRIESRMQDITKDKVNSNGLPETNRLNELCTRCLSLICDYQKKWDKKNQIIKGQ